MAFPIKEITKVKGFKRVKYDTGKTNLNTVWHLTRIEKIN